MACHCVLKKAATSLCGPTNHGSMRMWKYVRFLLSLGEEGIGSESSQVVSAFRCVSIGLRGEGGIEEWRSVRSCWEGSSRVVIVFVN